MAINVFVYGSLMFPRVWDALVSARYQSVPSRLRDFRRHGVQGESYPAIVATPGAEVRGLVWLHVEPQDLDRLDRFEGDDYRRIAVSVESLDPARAGTLTATAYVWKDPSRLLDVDWDPAHFERTDLERFARRFLPPS